MSYDASEVAFVDTETTGLDPELDFVWEIAVIVDGAEHVWQQRLPSAHEARNAMDQVVYESSPDWSVVDDWVLENTGIRDRYDHDFALTPADSIDRLVNLIDGRHIIGACPWFDSERLHRVNLAESGQRALPWHYHLIDVENLVVGYLRGLSVAGMGHEAYNDDWSAPLPWKSIDLSLALGVDPDDFQPKHSALADARWAKAMYEAMMGGPA